MTVNAQSLYGELSLSLNIIDAIIGRQEVDIFRVSQLFDERIFLIANRAPIRQARLCGNAVKPARSARVMERFHGSDKSL